MHANRTVFIALLRQNELVFAAQAWSERARSEAVVPSTTRSAVCGSDGTSQRKSAVAAAAPTSCATMKPGASAGRMPAKVSLEARANVTAGLANDVDEVNQ